MPNLRKSKRVNKHVSFAKALPKKNAKVLPKKKIRKDKISKKKKTEPEDAEALMKMLYSKNNVVGNLSMSTKSVLTFTGNSTGYDSAKDKSLLVFCWALKQNPELKFLCDKGDSGKQRFFELTADKRNSSVKSVINIALVNWIQKLVKKRYRNADIEKMSEKEYADAQYEPNSIQLFERMIFSSLRINVS